MESSVIAAAFARALDHDDYAAAGALLADECEYHQGSGEVVRGRDQVLTPYRETSEKGKRLFDAVGYRSEVEASQGSTASILFIDTLRRGEHHHEFRCRQTVEVDDRGLIVRIHHHELEGQREALRAFFARAGVVW